MRRITLVAVVGALLLFPADRVGLSAQSTSQDLYGCCPMFGGPQGGGYTLTISRNGALLTRLEIPKGFYINVHGNGDSRPVFSRELGGSEFHGDVTIRVRPANEVDLSDVFVQSRHLSN